jgi:cyanate lyase
MMTKRQAADVVRDAKAKRGLTWARLAEAVGAPVPWTVSALRSSATAS